MAVVVLFGILAVIFAFLSQKKKVAAADTGGGVTTHRYEQFSNVYFMISFLLLAVPCFFCGTGTDMQIYVPLYESSTLSDVISSKYEPGYVLLTVLLKVFINDPYVGLGLIKVASLYMVYKSFYMLRDRVQLGFAVLSYVVLLYIFNYHLLRMMLALGLVFLALSYEMMGESKKSLSLIAAAFFFHYTSAIVLLAYVIYRWLKKEMTFVKLMVLSVVLVSVYLFAVPILRSIIASYESFGKYQTYLKDAVTDRGLAQIVLFLPILFILKVTYDRNTKDGLYVISLVFGVMLFFTGSLGYQIPVVSRMTYYFTWIAMVYFAVTPLIDDKYILVAGSWRMNSTTAASIIYLVLQCVIMYVLNDSFASNGLAQYTVWWEL